MIGRLLNNELETKWKEVAEASFAALSRHMLEETEDNTRNGSQDIWCPGRDMNPSIPEYKPLELFRQVIHKSIML
jgi:hypothetical protein